MLETRATAYDSKIEGNVIFTRFDAALNWVRKNSLWPMPMGLACCAIELMATAASRFDIACASTGGMYRSYAVLQGIDQLLPVDVYISGCPPRPEALLAGLMKLQEKISSEPALRDQAPQLAEKLEEMLA